jgi:hypothetical protein
MQQSAFAHYEIILFKMRFGFVSNKNSSCTYIAEEFAELYPKEPRKLDFALFRLGSEGEENFCR